MKFLSDIVGGPANGRIIFFVGLVLAFLAALPDLIPTFLALLKILPIKESALENVNKGVETIKLWSFKTRLVMAIFGVLVMIVGGVVVLSAGPVGIEDQVSTHQGESVRINVLINDRDPDGHPVTLIGWSKISRYGGDVDCTGDGVCTYTPPPNLVEGIDNFTYDIAYGKNSSKKITGLLVTVQVDPAPTATVTPTPTASPTATEAPSSTPTATVTDTETPTETQATLVVQATTEVPATTIVPTDTSTPTPTLSPTATSTPTGTPTLTSTPTPTFAVGDAILVTKGYLYIRPGPGRHYGVPLGTLAPEVTARILGVDPDGFWWQIECPDEIGPAPFGCWVTSDPGYSTAQNAENVPVVPLPPTPTPAG